MKGYGLVIRSFIMLVRTSCFVKAIGMAIFYFYLNNVRLIIAYTCETQFHFLSIMRLSNFCAYENYLHRPRPAKYNNLTKSNFPKLRIILNF